MSPESMKDPDNSLRHAVSIYLENLNIKNPQSTSRLLDREEYHASKFKDLNSKLVLRLIELKEEMNGNKSLDTPHGIVVVYPHGSEFKIFSDLKENKNCFLFLHRLMNPVVPTFEIGNSFVLLKEFNIDE